MSTHPKTPNVARDRAAPGNAVLLTVSGTIPDGLKRDIAAGLRPRVDYVELARTLGADVLDYAQARSVAGAPGRLMEKIGGPNLVLAYACWTLKDRYRAIVTDGEQVGLPFAALLKLSRAGRPSHIMIVHVLSVPKKAVLIDWGRLCSQIDRFVTYASSQRSYIQARWAQGADKVALIPFMVDERFFDVSQCQRKPKVRPQICAVGLERRDYPTLLQAVDGLDIDVVIAAASPWSKQNDSTSGQNIPANVTVRKFSQYDLRQLYADSDFVVMPLQPVDFQAGITAILEAMAMGKPVICSRVPGQTDVIVDGENGRYVPVGDPTALRSEITRLMAHPDEIARLGAKARRQVERELSLDHYADRLASIVKETVEQPLLSTSAPAG